MARAAPLAESPHMEISWFGQGCIRLRGREGIVVADAYRSVVGPSGRGLTADITTYSHRGSDGAPIPRPASLESAFALDGPGEYEVHDILVTGVRTFRDDTQGTVRGLNVSFVYELDGLHTVHLGEIGHLLTEEMLGEIGTVEVVCVPLGGALSTARTAELLAQLDPKLVVPLGNAGGDDAGGAETERFLHEMGVQGLTPQPKLVVTISSLPEETTTVLLESRAPR